MGPGKQRDFLSQRLQNTVSKRRSISKSVFIIGILLALLCIAVVTFRTDVKFHATEPKPTSSEAPEDTNGSSLGERQAVPELPFIVSASSLSGGAASGGTALGGTEKHDKQLDKLLLATHNRLFWYYYNTNKSVVLHEGQGVHYGVFPGSELDANGQPSTIWVVIRPHNWHPRTTEESLVELDSVTGVELRHVRIPARFTHDAVRRGNSVFVCSTGSGEVLELALPDLHKVQSMALFTLQDHVNTLAPIKPGELWVVLHNLGNSDVVKLDLTENPPKEVARLRGVGKKAHGLVAWHNHFVMLDSENGALQLLDPTDGTTTRLWQATEGGKFLKGLTVVDDVAYFGISVWSKRQARGDPGSDSELGAFDLTAGRLLWRRSVPTRGLLNIVAAPHLAESSTYLAVYTEPSKQQGAATKAVHANQVMGLAAGRKAGAGGLEGMPSAKQAATSLSGTRPRPSATALDGNDAAIEDALMTVRVAEEQLSSDGATRDDAAKEQGIKAQVTGKKALRQHRREVREKEKERAQVDTQQAEQHAELKARAAGVTADGLPQERAQEAASETAKEAATGVAAEVAAKPAVDVATDGALDLAGDKDMGPLWQRLRAQGLAQPYRKATHLPLPERFRDALDWSYNRSGYPPVVTDKWLNGRPRLSTSWKQTGQAWEGGLQLPLLNANITALKARLLGMPDSMWKEEEHKVSNAIIGGRGANMRQFKPGVDAIMLIFSDQSGANVYRFPYYDYFAKELEPLLDEILGEQKHNIIRLQFARMNPNVQIKLHRDMGGYAKDAHRVHAVVAAHEDVRFEICPGVDEQQQQEGAKVLEMSDTVDGYMRGCLAIALYEGLVFEINNRIVHRVVNPTPVPRIQMVVDIMEQPRKQMVLAAGAKCDYVHTVITCPKDAYKLDKGAPLVIS